MAGDKGNPQLVHQLVVAGGHLLPVDLCDDAAARDFPDIRDAGAVDLFAVSPLEALADRVGGGAFGEGGVLEDFFVFNFAVVDAAHLKVPLGQGAGLIEDDDSGLGEGFEIVGAFDEDTGLARPADAGEEGKGDADDQRAGGS